ncbi:hypothetical protein [Streptomyces sp. NPDC003077]|uniref:hypothetical protein n=1 Tax=Streptomyces sp. NPDC003077 TaxID=3154443 RepID=UPI0033A1CC37
MRERPHPTPSAVHGTAGAQARPSAAITRQVERNSLDELIQAAEAEHGPVTQEEIDVLRDRLHRARPPEQP